MRKIMFVCSFLAAAFLVAGPIAATAAPATEAPRTGDRCVKDSHGRLKCEFDGDKVEAGLVTHEGKFIGGKIPPVFDSLIDYRLNFLPEFDKTVEEL